MKNLCNQYLLLAKKEAFAAIRKNRQQPFEDICNALQHIYDDIKIEYDALSVKIRLLFPFRYPMICDTLYFGGMLISIWI